MSRAPSVRSRRRGAEDFLRVVLRFVPPEAREGVREIFRAGRERSSENDINVFLMLCAETGQAWLRHMERAE